MLTKFFEFLYLLEKKSVTCCKLTAPVQLIRVEDGLLCMFLFLSFENKDQVA